MADPTFSIILPTHRHGRLLRNAIRSILGQTRQDFEVFLVCDGAIEEGLEIAREQARRDGRFVLREHPKGPGHGELYRDAAVREANGTIICYHADDDFWLENHLQAMEDGLEDADMTYSTLFRCVPGGHFSLGPKQPVPLGRKEQRLDNSDYRALCLKRPNLCRIAQLSASAHRRDSYFKLSEGWTPRPRRIISYANLWINFVANDSLRIRPLDRVTSVIMPNNMWHGPLTGTTRTQFRQEQTAMWMKLMRCRFLQAALNHACTLPQPVAPGSISAPYMAPNFRRRMNGSDVIQFDGHLADAAQSFYRARPSLAKRLALTNILWRLKSIAIESREPDLPAW